MLLLLLHTLLNKNLIILSKWETKLSKNLSFVSLLPDSKRLDEPYWNLDNCQGEVNNKRFLKYGIALEKIFIDKTIVHKLLLETSVDQLKSLNNVKGRCDGPSGWAIFCMAVGAIMMGIDNLKPRTVVVMSILLTSIRIRGRNLYLINKFIKYNQNPTRKQTPKRKPKRKKKKKKEHRMICKSFTQVNKHQH